VAVLVSKRAAGLSENRWDKGQGEKEYQRVLYNTINIFKGDKGEN
jgi:hypothetical protein